MPYSRQTSATLARSSMTPKFVVPHVATTAKNDSGPFSSSTARRFSPVSRHASSAGTPTNCASMTSQADAIDECAPAVAATRYGRSPGFAEARAVCRAVTSAERLPIVPPGVNTPPAPDGIPTRSAIQRSAWFSAYTAPEPSSQEPA